MSKDPLPFKLTSFVAENILNELKTDDSGTIAVEILPLVVESDQSWRETIEDVPILPKSGTDKKSMKEHVEAELAITIDANASNPELEDEIREKVEEATETGYANALLTIAAQHEKYLRDLTIPELLSCRREIEKKLPATKLKDLDLEKELVLHFLNLKELMTLILYDEDVPANQKAQIANSCASLLSQMTKSQATIYSAERIKRMETAMIKALHGLPQEVLEEFFTRYEEVYDEDNS